MTFHVATGRDPRGVTGLGGAVINYACHSMPTVMEPLVNLISSGVFERHPTLMAGSIEGGLGWVPWMLEAMDYSLLSGKHRTADGRLVGGKPREDSGAQCRAGVQGDSGGEEAVVDFLSFSIFSFCFLPFDFPKKSPAARGHEGG